MSEQTNLGFGHTDWTRGAGRARKAKQEYHAAKTGFDRVGRLIKTELRKLEYAQRNQWSHDAVRKARAAEARLIDHRRAEGGFVDRMRELEREALTL